MSRPLSPAFLLAVVVITGASIAYVITSSLHQGALSLSGSRQVAQVAGQMYQISGANPAVLAAAPQGAQLSGTTQLTISAKTNVNATCRYSTTAGTAYGSMTNTFSTTGGTTHSSVVSGLVDGGIYYYYVRCQDTSGNTDSIDTPIAFSIMPAATSGLNGGLVPSDRSIDWTHAGVPGGIPHYPQGNGQIYNVMNYGAKADGVTDDTAAVNAAINAATAAGSVIYMPTGTYRLNSTITLSSPHQIVLRGDGPNKTKIVSYSSDAAIYVGYNSPSHPTTANVTGGMTKGSTQITVDTISSTHVGDVARLNQLDDPSIIFGHVENPGRNMGQMVKIASCGTSTPGALCTSTTLTLDRPLYFNYNAAFSPQLLVFNGYNYNEGVEDLSVEYHGTFDHNIYLIFCAECWVKDVYSSNAVHSNVALLDCYQCEVKDSFFQYHQVYDSDARNGFEVCAWSSESLIENNIFDGGNNGGIFCQGASGNVVSFNYGLHGYGAGYPSDGSLKDGFSSHGTGFLNLWEGNVTPWISQDNYWGPNRSNTAFRNWITRYGYSNPTTVAQYNLDNIYVDATNWYDNYLGNVLNRPTDAGDTQAPPNAYNHLSWYVGFARYTGSCTGCYSTTNGAPPNAPDDLKTVATLFTHGNYDYIYGNAQWAPTVTNHTLPASFYYTATPSWWPGTIPWPPIGPDVANIANQIPSQICFLQGWNSGGNNGMSTTLTMPNCLSGATATSFSIVASAGTNGTISPAGTITVNSGGSQTFTFTPASGYTVGTVTVDGTAQANPGTSYTFSNITTNHTISVTFTQNTTVGGIFPSQYVIDWTHAGVTNTYPGGIPNRTTVCTTLQASSYGNGTTDASAAINSAIANCPNGQVVQLSAGVFRANSVITIPNGKSITLRGAGPNSSMSASTDSSTDGTTIESYDSAGSSNGAIEIGANPGGRITSNVTAGANRGSTSIMVDSITGYHVGDLGRLYQTALDPNFVFWSSTAKGPELNGTPYGDVGDMFTITAINTSTNTITIDHPLGTTFNPTYTTKFETLPNIAVLNGIENLTLNNNGTDDYNIYIYGGRQNWVKNVKSFNSNHANVSLLWCYECEVRDSILSYHLAYDSNARYAVQFDYTSSYNLVENNVVQGHNLTIVPQEGATGNVVAYNFNNEGFGNGFPTDTASKGYLDSHGDDPNFTLFEGNVHPFAQDDNYWTNNRSNTYFRNWLTKIAYGNLSHTVQETKDFAIRIQGQTYHDNIVGNVMGTPGDTTPSLVLGPDQNGGASDPMVAQTTFVHGNYDYTTKTTTWDANTTNHTLPASMYLASKPAWFGSIPFPPIGVDASGNPITNQIPAQVCYAQGQMPNCLTTGGTVTTYTITASAGANGSITPGTVTVNSGASQTFTFAPATGYAVGTVTVDGSAISNPGTSYTFTNVTANHTISVTFSAVSTADTVPPTVSVTAPTSGSTVSGAAVTMSATASDNIAVASVKFYMDNIISTNLLASDTAAPYTGTFNSTNYSSGTHTLYAVAADTSGNTANSSVSFTISNLAAGCSLSNTTAWTDTSITSQTGSFTAAFDASPSALNTDDLVGLSSVAAAAYADLAAAVRFNSSGSIDVLNGTSYTALTPITYAAGSSYHFRLVVNVLNHIYTVYVTPPGGSEVTLATNAAFRSTQASVTSLNYWDMFGDPVGGGNVKVCNFALSGAAPVVSGAQAASVTSSGAWITWSTDILSDSQVAYGLTSSYTSQTALDSTQVTSHAEQITGLQPSTTYHFQARSSASGMTGSSPDLTFTTGAVAPAPLLSMTISPLGITLGQSATITWSSTNATACTGTNFSTGNATSGTVSVSPTVTTTYTITCSGAGGTISNSLTVTVSSSTTKFTLGQSVVTNGTANIRSTAGGKLVGTQPAGATGVVVAGPQTAKYQGKIYTWYYVNFTSGPNGWLIQDSLSAN